MLIAGKAKELREEATAADLVAENTIYFDERELRKLCAPRPGPGPHLRFFACLAPSFLELLEGARTRRGHWPRLRPAACVRAC